MGVKDSEMTETARSRDASITTQIVNGVSFAVGYGWETHGAFESYSHDLINLLATKDLPSTNGLNIPCQQA